MPTGEGQLRIPYDIEVALVFDSLEIKLGNSVFLVLSINMKPVTYRVIIEPDENNSYHAYVPALPGCHTWGDSLSSAKQHIREAIELYLEDLIAHGKAVPEEESFDTFETVIAPTPG